MAALALAVLRRRCHAPRPFMSGPHPRRRPDRDSLGEEIARETDLPGAFRGGDEGLGHDVALGVAAANADGLIAQR